MGNEMGNNNTSELREEEDNKSSEREDKLKEENSVVPAAEDNGKDSEVSAAADDDPMAAIHTNGKESLSEETEVHLSIVSRESEKKLVEESSIATEFQITNSLPEKLEDNSSPDSSNSKDNVSVMSKDQIGNESYFNKEEEAMVNPSSVASLTRDLESEDSAEQESEQVEAVQSEQEEIGSQLHISETNILLPVQEKGHESDNNISDKTEETAAFETVFQEDVRPINERLEVENGEGILEAEILKENDEDKEVSLPEETKLIAKESLNADDDSYSNVNTASNPLLRPNTIENGIHCEWQLTEGPISVDRELINGESEEKGPVNEQTLEIEANTEETVPTEDQLPITFTENGDDRIPDESKPEGKLESCNSELLETEALPFDVKSTLVPAVELPIEKPDETEAIQLVESESVEGNTALVPEIHSKQESEDSKSLEDEQSLEISEKTEPPEFSEAFKPSLSAFLFHPEDQLQETATYSEDAQVLKYLTSELKLTPGSEFLEAEALPIYAAATSSEASVPEINLPIATEILEILTETNPSDSDNHSRETCNGSVPEISIREKKEDENTLEIEAKTEKPEIAEAYKPSFPASLLHPEDQQQKTARKSEDNRAFDHSIVKLESNSQFLGEPTSPFYTLMETKPEEAEAISVRTPEILTETSPENLEDRYAKYCNGPIPETSTGKRKEDEQTLEIEEKSKPSEFAEEYKPIFPNSLLYPEDQQQKAAANCKDDRGFDVSASGVKLESNSESTLVPAVDLTIGNPGEAGTPKILTESNPSGSENDSAKSCNSPNLDISNENLTDETLPGTKGELTEQTEKVKILTTDNKEQEAPTRLSIESNPESYNSRAEMRKSPSFGPDLRIEAAKTEESEQTPLLYQNKSTNQEAISPPPIPPQEKAIRLEKSNSNKLKPPFLAEPKQQDKQVKDKHKRRSSLFTNCMCCTTVIN